MVPLPYQFENITTSTTMPRASALAMKSLRRSK